MFLWVSYKKKKYGEGKKIVCTLKPLKKRVVSGVGSGSGARSGSISQRYGSADPYQNVTDPQHCFLQLITSRRIAISTSLLC